MKKVKFTCPDIYKEKVPTKIKQPKLPNDPKVNKKMVKRLDRGILEMSSQIARYDNIDSYVNMNNRGMQQ